MLTRHVEEKIQPIQDLERNYHCKNYRQACFLTAVTGYLIAKGSGWLRSSNHLSVSNEADAKALQESISLKAENNLLTNKQSL